MTLLDTTALVHAALLLVGLGVLALAGVTWLVYVGDRGRW